MRNGGTNPFRWVATRQINLRPRRSMCFSSRLCRSGEPWCLFPVNFFEIVARSSARSPRICTPMTRWMYACTQLFERFHRVLMSPAWGPRSGSPRPICLTPSYRHCVISGGGWKGEARRSEPFGRVVRHDPRRRYPRAPGRTKWLASVDCERVAPLFSGRSPTTPLEMATAKAGLSNLEQIANSDAYDSLSDNIPG